MAPDFQSYLVLPSGDDRCYTISKGSEDAKASTRRFLQGRKAALLRGYNSEARKKSRIVIRDIGPVYPLILRAGDGTAYRLSWIDTETTKTLQEIDSADRLELEDLADKGYKK